MGRIYYRSNFAWAAGLALAASLYFALYVLPALQGGPASALKGKAAGQPANAAENQSLFEQVALAEYNITVDKKTGILQSPNRTQNIRSYFKPGLLSLRNRINQRHPFEISLATEGIFADGKLLHEPAEQAASIIDKNRLLLKHGGFTEEFINNSEGIRQNFIVENAPANTRQIEVKLKASGVSAVKTSDAGLDLYYGEDNTPDQRLTYTDLKCWDATGKALSSSMHLEGLEITLNVATENAVFPVTIDPIIAHGNPANANTQLFGASARDNMGFSVQTAGDLNGDGFSDIVLGVVGYDNGIKDQGAAFVCYGSASGVVTSTFEKLEGKVSEILFGYAVSTAGDINGDGFSDIIVGAPNYENGQSFEGAVFVYYGSGSGVGTDPSDTLESGVMNARMGESVALAGDVDEDGFSDVIVGLPGYTNGEIREGAAYIYRGSANGLLPQPQVIESNQAHAALGTSVAGAGDVNGDGYSDVIAGAPLYDNNETNEGAAFVHTGGALGINLNPITTLESNQQDARLGTSVASAGDYNADGLSDVVVGSPMFDNGEQDEGVAFAYQGIANGGVSGMPKDTLEGDQALARFGTSVSCAGDVNGDGFSDVIAGAPDYANALSKEGAAFIFHGASIGFGLRSAILESDQAEAQMGISVASAGDVNGDGYSDVITGANLYDVGTGIDNGSAFVFHGSASSIALTPNVMLGTSQEGAQFGYSVTGAGDLNGDGFNDIAVGAPHYDNGSGEEGSVFIFYGKPSGVPAVADQKLDIGQLNAGFGTSVSAAGDINGDGYGDLIVGVPYYDASTTDNGAAFIYHGSPGGVSIIWNMVLEGTQTNEFFGFSVAGAGDVNGDGIRDVIIGAPSYDKLGSSNCGAAFVHTGSTLGITNFYTKLEGTQAESQLGFSVASAGDVNGDGYNDVVAGAVKQSNGEAIEGAAFVFYGDNDGVDNQKWYMVESNDAGAMMGFSVSSAGDVNADGFSDIVVGAPLFHNKPGSSEGAAFIYYGSNQGTQTVGNLRLKGLQPDAHFGAAVSGAGDLNGDGYSDVVVGAPDHDNGKNNEGAAFVFDGTPGGLSPSNPAMVESNFADARMGVSVSGAGDVNGDGYSDVVIGLINYNLETSGIFNNSIDGGAAFVYHGNLGAKGLKNNLRVYNSDLVSNISYLQIKKDDFGFGLHVRSFLGSGKVRLVWEARKEGTAFYGNGNISNSTNFSGQQSQYADLAGGGSELKTFITKPGFDTKIRARARFNLVKALTGQVYGPWRFLPAYTQSSYTILKDPQLPVTLVAFKAKAAEGNVSLEWSTSEEINSDRFEIQRSTDGQSWMEIGNLKSHENAHKLNAYSFLDTMACASAKRYYRLKMIDLDGTFAFSHIESVTLAKGIDTKIYPNPTADVLNLRSEQKVTEVQVFNAEGKAMLVVRDAKGVSQVDIRKLPSGIYLVKINGESFQILKR
ncbi:FG-GAP-like repeat-containing protein [Dyadobacter fermentans]|uniref:FG-GAP repeat protein n=1 Tax=Dyadobacter fermentans (strain ATCC 700827 / DSM 18053 / CIP 107007 / KCTC 52180 / NS114) TaxID=471854 RepID=C6VXD0_DYAFD|nr:FG-GAP-like repeat-containing protein [Dyadobacter fermentans]ACT93273.1 FG-GAP repeat protein [Dyadobacter fermentans DSM 18053]